jgi:N utilization substance protein B
MALSRMPARSRARRGAVQALYQWQVGGSSSADIRTEFRERDGMQNVDWSYFDALVDGVIRDVDTLDALLTPRLDRAVASLDPVERAILRLAALELRDHPEVPFRVVINESIELARTFGAEQSHRYVNGVLDALARDVRPGEARNARP